MKKYLFKNLSVSLIVKASNDFMACCYANQFMEKRYVGRFDTSDAIELENDMDFGVVAAITGDDLEIFNSDNKFYENKS